MGFNRNMFKAVKNISMVSQLALSVVTPCFITIAICTWLKNKFSLGSWIVVIGILWGIISGICSVRTYMKKAIKDAEIQQQEYENQFK